MESTQQLRLDFEQFYVPPPAAVPPPPPAGRGEAPPRRGVLFDPLGESVRSGDGVTAPPSLFGMGPPRGVRGEKTFIESESFCG